MSLPTPLGDVQPGQLLGCVFYPSGPARCWVGGEYHTSGFLPVSLFLLLLGMASEHESGGGVRMRTVHLYAFGLGPSCTRIRGHIHDPGRDFIHVKSR